MFEHANGCYGGTLFCFTFKCDIKEYSELKEQFEKGNYITIPAGTQFGFHSSFQDASSCFERRTYRNMKIKIRWDEKNYIPKYDHLGFIADLAQTGYSMEDVFGESGFINQQNITIN